MSTIFVSILSLAVLSHGVICPGDVCASWPERQTPPEDAKPMGLTFADLKFEIPADEEFRAEMIPDSVKELDGDAVRIRGFIFPGKNIKRTGNTLFVLIRDVQESFPWPLHDSIVVRLPEGKTARFSVRPVTVQGKFRVVEHRSDDGKVNAVYEIVADEVQYANDRR